VAEALVSAVIPSWNQAVLVGRVLQNLKKQTVAPAQTIVVDNGSTDSTIDIAKSLGAAVIAFESNRGFAAAVNAGIQAAKGEWVLILNNDVELDSGWIERALEAADAEKSPIVGGKLLQAASPARIDGTWDLLAASGCAWRCGWNAPDGPIWNKRKRVAMLPLTACLVHRRVFEAVGLLDEAYESYYEDVDFSLRCALAGFVAVYEPAASALHLGSATLGSARTGYFISRNQVLLARKFGLVKESPLRVVVGQSLFVLTQIRQRGFLAALKGKWDGIRAARAYRPRRVARSELRAFLAMQEKELFQLQSQLGWDRSWKIYFSMLGCV
jgi:GT2 family glycosyltransferase